MLWDLISLTNIGTLKAHKDEIRVLERGTNLLVSGGRSQTADPSVYVWDLKTASPIDQMEKHSDIYSLKVMKNDYEIYTGSSSKFVKYLNLRDKSKCEDLTPPHLDTVSSLTMMDGALVSGSRDSNLRFWD
jgi:hypothetical protein